MSEPKTILELIGRGDPRALALGAPGRAPLSYAGLSDRVEQTARALGRAGLSRGDRVALALPNGPELAAAVLGVAATAAAAPLNPAHRKEELEFLLADLRANALIVQKDREGPAARVAEALGVTVIVLTPEPDGPAGSFALDVGAKRPVQRSGGAHAQDLALLLHTSGTTARPKLVPLTHANLCASARNVGRALALSPGDRCLNVMPLFHVHGLVAALLASLAAGAQVALTPGFDALRFFRWLAECRPTWYTAVPTMHQLVLARAARHRRAVEACAFRLVRSSSAPLPRATMAGLEETFGAPAIESYGMTEAAHQMTSNPLPPAPRKPGTVGLPAGPEVAVMDEAGRLLAPGETGEVVIRGENVMGGYDHNPESNAEAFVDGWLRTGDRGIFDADGYLSLSGRLKEIINRGGEKISPREVDEVLASHPAVAQAAAFPVSHPRLGQDVAAAVVLRPDAEADEEVIRAFAAERLSAFKVPRRILVVERIPTGATGKLQRATLAKALGLET